MLTRWNSSTSFVLFYPSLLIYSPSLPHIPSLEIFLTSCFFFLSHHIKTLPNISFPSSSTFIPLSLYVFSSPNQHSPLPPPLHITHMHLFPFPCHHSFVTFVVVNNCHQQNSLTCCGGLDKLSPKKQEKENDEDRDRDYKTFLHNIFCSLASNELKFAANILTPFFNTSRCWTWKTLAKLLWYFFLVERGREVTRG